MREMNENREEGTKEKMMMHKEADYEALTLQKLEAMEDLLKSFMSSLKEPSQKIGEGSTPVEAPITGRIHWYSWVHSGKKVKINERLGYVESSEEHVLVSSPDEGTLRILVPQGWVSEGTTIATIEKRFNIV